MPFMVTLIVLFIVFFSIILHEFCHGYVAYLNGDETARMMGRLTFNPLPHIDPFTTVLLPVILLIASGGRFAIGMAKPVPVNPFNFRNYDRGMLTVGLAGPVSNIVFGALLAFFSRFLAIGFIREVMLFGSRINFILAFFNLIPIPPLDGSRVLSVFLPRNMRYRYEQFERYGMIIVIALLFFGGLEWLFPLSGKMVAFFGGTNF
ncbi:MAG TPA: site-2 protease family protein [bacterium]|nr:site-2 protease family protein [bacterium]